MCEHSESYMCQPSPMLSITCIAQLWLMPCVICLCAGYFCFVVACVLTFTVCCLVGCPLSVMSWVLRVFILSFRLSFPYVFSWAVPPIGCLWAVRPVCSLWANHPCIVCVPLFCQYCSNRTMCRPSCVLSMCRLSDVLSATKLSPWCVCQPFMCGMCADRTVNCLC